MINLPLSALLLFLVFLYAHQNSETKRAIEFLKKSVNTCEQNGESVVAKLKGLLVRD